MLEFKNLECHPAPNTLYQPEIDMLLHTVYEVLDYFEAPNAKGTVIVDGRPNGKEAQCIMRCDLPGGRFSRQLFGVIERTSADIAEESIDKILEWPGEGECSNACKCSEGQGCSKRLKTGYYQDDKLRELNVFILNTLYGQFYITAAVDTCASELCSYTGEDVAEVIIRLVAIAITQLCTCKQDTCLRESEDLLFGNLYCTMSGYVWEELEGLLFSDEATAEPAQAWREWRAALKESGEELKLMFQE